MPLTPQRFGWPRQFATVLLVIVLLGASVLVGIGLYRSLARGDDGIWLVVCGVGSMALALFLFLLVLVCLKQESNTYRVHDSLLDLLQTVNALRAPMQTIASEAKISDAARSLAHRDEERAALRAAIQEETYKANWEAATYLLNQMEQRFGYGEEAERLRQQITDSRQMAIETKIEQALARIDELLEATEWDKARVETERLVRLFPADERVRVLPERLKQRRERHKRELLIEWDEVVARREVDRAIQLLHELDQYLTPEEGTQLRDSAREVLKDKLLNLAVQFKLAVADRRWNDALDVGLEIIEERPNSKMAAEVKALLPKLQERAGMATDAVVIDQRPGKALS